MSLLSEIRARAVQPRWMCDSCGHENNEVCPACRTRQQGIAAGTILPPLNDAGYLLARLDHAIGLLKRVDKVLPRREGAPLAALAHDVGQFIEEIES